MADRASLDKTRHILFNTTAPRYDRLIMPAFRPLAKELVRLAALQPDEPVIDLGAGIGAVAFPAGRLARQVMGLDYAQAMLPIARKNAIKSNLKNVTFHQGDMHRLPYGAGSFAVTLASFTFNSVDPRQVFSEVQRILQPGGRLVFQEWGKELIASSR